MELIINGRHTFFFTLYPYNEFWTLGIYYTVGWPDCFKGWETSYFYGFSCSPPDILPGLLLQYGVLFENDNDERKDKNLINENSILWFSLLLVSFLFSAGKE